MSRTIVVRNPPELPDLPVIKNNTVIIGFDPETGKMVRVYASILLTGVGYPEWNPTDEWEEDEITIWQLRFWQAKVDVPAGNIPAENDLWTEVSPPGIPMYNIDGGDAESNYGTIAALDGGTA